ncbi:hypothetical protein AOLI_G00141190 [Acnodon oligacanthus]
MFFLLHSKRAHAELEQHRKPNSTRQNSVTFSDFAKLRESNAAEDTETQKKEGRERRNREGRENEACCANMSQPMLAFYKNNHATHHLPSSFTCLNSRLQPPPGNETLNMTANDLARAVLTS